MANYFICQKGLAMPEGVPLTESEYDNYTAAIHGLVHVWAIERKNNGSYPVPG